MNLRDLTMTSPAGWSDLSHDFLAESIFCRLELADFIRARMVCTSWGSCIEDEVCRYQHKLPQTLPWLMLSSLNKPETRYFYSLTEQKLYEIHVPDISNHSCIGSSEGFLISIDHEAQLHATNPITGTHILLPPTAFLPKFTGVARDPASGQLREYYVWDSEDEEEEEEEDIVADDGDHQELITKGLMRTRLYYFVKAILSPCCSVVVVIQFGSPHLVFTRLGSNSWTAVEHNSAMSSVEDVIFHKGHLLAVDSNARVAIFDHPNSPSGACFRSLVAEPELAGFYCNGNYLIESPCGDNLFLIMKWTQEVPLHRNRDYFNDDNDDDVYLSRTWFRVFKFQQQNTSNWVEMTNLGEHAVFLGFNRSVMIPTEHFPNVKENCIYFIDQDLEAFIERPDIAGDIQVFSLDDQSIRPLKQVIGVNDDVFRSLNWQPPMWFTPTLARMNINSLIGS